MAILVALATNSVMTVLMVLRTLVAYPSPRRSGINRASLKVIYLWFMKEKNLGPEVESFPTFRRRGGKSYRSATMDNHWYRLHVASHRGRSFRARKDKEERSGHKIYLLTFFFFSYYQRKKFPPKFEYFVNRTRRIAHIYRTINPIGLKKQVLRFFSIFPATYCHELRFLLSFTRRSFLFPILVLWYHTQEY